MRRAAVARTLFKGGLVLVGVVIAFIMVKHAFHRMLFQNDHFALKQVEFSTDGKLSKASVLDRLGLTVGENLLSLDLAEMERVVEELPTVADAKISKVLPVGLAIELDERQPVAWLSCPPLGIRPRSSTSGQLIDADGYAVACDRLRIEYMSFPVVEVSDIPVVVTGRRIDSPMLETALMCLSSGNAQLMPMRASISEIRAINDYSLLVVLKSGEEAIISSDDAPRDVTRLAAAYGELSHTLNDPRAWRVNLLAQRNVPLQFIERKRGSSSTLSNSRLLPSSGSSEIRAPRPRVVDPTEIEARFGSGASAPSRGSSMPSVDNDLHAILNRG